MGINVVAQMIAWGIFTFTDYYEETTSNDYELIICFAVPVVYFLFYLIFRRRIYDTVPVKWKEIAMFFGIWLVLGVSFGTVITFMTCQWNNWIVHRDTGGWEHFLNGLEYPLFGFMLVVGFVITAVLCEAVIGIINYIKKKD